jgi:MFS family permease
VRWPWGSPLVLGLLVGGAAAAAALVWAERRAVSPIIDLGLFRTRAFAIAAALALGSGLAILPTVLFLPLFLVNVAGVSVTAAGTALIPQTLAIVLAAITSGNLVQRTGRYKPAILFGLMLAVVSYILLSIMGVETNTLGVVWRVVLLGFGLGCVIPLLSLIAQNALPYRFAGSASSTVQFCQQMGGVLGTVIFGALLSALLTAQFADHVEPLTRELPVAQRQAINIDRLRNGSAGGEGAATGLTLPPDMAPADAYLLRAAVRLAFADSITSVYRYVVGLGIITLLIALALPEIPLRRSNTDESE